MTAEPGSPTPAAPHSPGSPTPAAPHSPGAPGRQRRWKPWAAGAAALAIVLPALGLLLNRLPWAEPPGVAKRLVTYLTIHQAELRRDSLYDELRPRVYPIRPEDLWRSIQNSAERLGWTVAELDPPGRRLHAVVVTPVLRFKDDVIVEAEHVGGGGSYLRIRSESRVGQGDLGANTRHILDFVQKTEEVLTEGRLLPPGFVPPRLEKTASAKYDKE